VAQKKDSAQQACAADEKTIAEMHDAETPDAATDVNPQITDAVAQTSLKVLAEAPAEALGTLYQSLAQASGLAMQNAVTAMQQGNVTAQAATTMCVQRLLAGQTDKGN